MFKTIALMTAVAGLLAGAAFSVAGPRQDETCSALQECPTSKKVDALLVRWEGAAKKAEAATPEQRAELMAKMTEVASKCPVGSRMSGALSTVRDTFGMVVAMETANAEHCPLANAPADDASCAEAKELKSARGHVLAKLHQLAGFAAGPQADAECCEGAQGACCAESDVAEATSCPIRMASRIGAMKAEFVRARTEAASLTPAARGEILAGFGSLAEACDCVALMPETIEALSEGFTVLSDLEAKMVAWAQANPEFMAQVPAEAHTAYRIESALLAEARGLVSKVTAAMQAMQPREADIEVGLAR